MTSTPAWQVDAWDLTGDLAKITQQWPAIHEILDEPALYDLRDPAISGWSCGEQAGHIAMVSLWIATGVQANLEAPARDVDGAWTEPTAAILEGGDFPRGAAEAPAPVDPTGRTRDDFITTLAEAECAWGSVGERAADLPKCRSRFAHFVLGFLTSTEWVRFGALHTAHHLAVVRDLRATG